MTTETTAIGLRAESLELTHETGAIAVNAAKVLDTTRRAWSEASAQAPQKAERRASKAVRRLRRTRASLFELAALHYWSPKPL
jgi:hypothetical protein